MNTLNFSTLILKEEGIAPENQIHFNPINSKPLEKRPLEIDQLKDPQMIRIHTDAAGIPTLWVYQTKLAAILKRYRWKLIPLVFGEQRNCLKIIEQKNFVRPLTKTVKHHFGISTNLYGGRKGFTDLMLSRKQNFINISQWMGHSSIERTWRNYKSRCLVHYNDLPLRNWIS